MSATDRVPRWEGPRLALPIPRVIGIGAATAVVAGLLVSSYYGLTRDLRTTPVGADATYRPVPIERGTFRETVVATGTIEPLSRVEVKSDVSGVVHEVLVEEGDRVRKDQPLVELDRERLEDRVAMLRAALEVRKANARQDVVGRARLALDQTRREHGRHAKLYDEGVLSTVRLQESADRLRLAQIGLADARAEQAAREAAVDEARESLRRAEKDLEKSQIRSPIDGVVIERAAEVGTAVADLLAGGTVVAVLADDERLRLLADVDENDIGRVRVGQLVEVRVDAFPGETFSGTVKRVSASGTVDRNVSNFEVEVEIEPDERLRIAMSVDARIVVQERRDALIVPSSAVLYTQGTPTLRVADPDRDAGFRLVGVDVVDTDGFRSVIAETDGIAEGNRVLVRAGAL